MIDWTIRWAAAGALDEAEERAEVLGGGETGQEEAGRPTVCMRVVEHREAVARGDAEAAVR